MSKQKEGIDLKLPYKLVKIKLETGSTQQFTRMENARTVRPSQVERITAALRRGEHFASPVVLNLKGDKYRVIDGNHRLDAMIRFLTGTKNTLEMEAAVYENLTSEEEIAVYAQWNAGIRQSSSDQIQVMRDELPIVQMLCGKDSTFPVKVHIYPPTANMRGVSVKTLLGAYYYSRHSFNNNPSGGRRGVSSYVSWVETLGAGEYEWLYDFVKVFETCFGTLEAKNPFCTQSFFVVFARVYHLNLKTFGRKEFVEACHRHIVGNAQIINQALIGRNRTAYAHLAPMITDALNKGKRKTSSWLCDWRLPNESVPVLRDAKQRV